MSEQSLVDVRMDLEGSRLGFRASSSVLILPISPSHLPEFFTLARSLACHRVLSLVNGLVGNFLDPLNWTLSDALSLPFSKECIA